jgi:DNA-binding transcriptional regulator GbsR (MarR family)
MGASRTQVAKIKKELADSKAVRRCAERHNTVGDLSAMKVCYLLRHHPDLSVSQIADLVGLSVSATSRCLTKLKTIDVVSASKVAQTVYYRLQDNVFTQQLMAEMEGLA